MSAEQPLILIDGSSYLYRAYHALPALTNAAGEPTGAIYGVAGMIRRMLEDYPGSPVAVVFDAPGRTFRDDLFDQYKANRPSMPDDLRAQREPLKELIEAMGLPLLEVAGVEADDVIGTLAVRAHEAGLRLVISTMDKDMAQLVNGSVTLLNTMSGTHLDADGVYEKFGVPPHCIVDWLALVGDSSDNIPGVPRVGAKTASKWLNEYGSLDALIRHADDIKGKVGESLREHLPALELSRQLATIHTDVDLDLSLSQLRPPEPDPARLADIYRRLGFSSWLSKLQDQEPEAAAPEPQRLDAEYECVLDEAALQRWLQRLQAAELFAFDLETDSLEYMNANIVGCSFAVEPGHAAYVPLAHAGLEAPAQLDRDSVLERLRPLLEAEDRPKVGQNLKYDMSVLARYGISLRGVRFDTMLESYCLDSTAAARHDMDSLAEKYLGHTCISFTDVAGKGAKQLTFDQVAVDVATEYAAEDADITLRLHRHLWPELEAREGPAAVFRDIEMPLVPVLSRMERTGVLVDRDLLADQSRELAEKMIEVEQAAYEAAGGEFNLGSPRQIQEILFERQGLPVTARTPKGQPSTAESVLEQLASDYELPRLILEHRGLSKLKSTYTDKLPRLIHPRTGRVHTSYQQAVAATGRLSSSDPNLQNIPVRSAEGRRIRRAFIPREGCRLMAADYSQVELRIMAHLSGDDGLTRAFASGRDIHRATAAEVFGVAEDVVGPDQRRAAKAINFGLIYGMSAWGLARQLGIDREQAQSYVERYFDRYPGVRAFMERTRREARERGYVETVFGRRLYLPEIRSRNNQRRQYAERTAINAPMQGTAADIIKRAMIRVDDWLRREREDAFLVLQVHDELVLEVPESAIDSVGERIRGFMEGAADLAVPLDVEIGVGGNWDEAH
jgi:DNA polymerase-1